MFGLLAVLLLAAQVAGAADGAAVYEQWCAHCHNDEPAAPGRLQLARTRGEAQSRLAHRNDLDASFVRSVVRRGLHEMPSFRATEISDEALEALVQWLTKQ